MHQDKWSIIQQRDSLWQRNCIASASVQTFMKHRKQYLTGAEDKHKRPCYVQTKNDTMEKRVC